MKYFVTGATGFIGAELVRQLRANGHEIIALARSPENASHVREMGAEVVKGDITDKESMRAPMTAVDGVFHVAGWYKVGVRDHSEADAINVDGTRNVCELMRELNIPKGVYSSTLAVFVDTHGQVVDEDYQRQDEFHSHYERTKWKAHYEIVLPMMDDGLPLVIVQPGIVYGPGDTSTMGKSRLLYLRGLLPLVPRKAAFCWSHVEDCARGHILAMENGRPGESYIIGGPQHRLAQVLDTAAAITGIPAPIIRPGASLMKLNAALMAGIGAVIPLPEAFRAESLRSSAGVTFLGSDAKAARELGWNPRSLEEGLRQTLPIEMAMLGIKPRKPM
jgi:nucleoside-diphosphate-sugar epimerase